MTYYITVIIPFKGKIKNLVRALESLENQKFKNFECIICVDGQNIFKYKKILLKKKINLRIIYNKINMGQSYSRNKAIQIANGKFVAFLDSDDFWTKDKLSSVYPKTKNYDLIFHDCIRVKNKSIINLENYKNYNFKSLLLSQNPFYLSSATIKKTIFFNLGGFDSKYDNGGEDYELWLKYFKNKYKYTFLKKNLAYYDDTKNNITKKNSKFYKSQLLIFSKYKKDFDKIEKNRKFKKKLFYKYYNIANFCMNKRKNKYALYFFNRSKKLSRFDYKFLIYFKILKIKFNEFF